MPQCKRCGFLTLRNPETQVVGDEAETIYREHGSDKRYTFVRAPFCFREAFNLWNEFEVLSEPRLAQILTENRHCDEFVTWQPGFTPKEHVEMKLIQELDRRTLAWREEDLRWQKQVEAIVETRHQEALDAARGQAFGSKWQAWGTIAGVVVAILLGIANLALWFFRP